MKHFTLNLFITLILLFCGGGAAISGVPITTVVSAFLLTASMHAVMVYLIFDDSAAIMVKS